MSALLWWLIPVGAVALTVGLVALVRRPAKSMPDITSDYLQLQRAMAKPLPTARRGRRSR
ncbi:MAG: hypothetical protein FJW97_04185 [Actinobacteria bacterium]|nr:hypothetical protein [Actinomycetota bacterium]